MDVIIKSKKIKNKNTKKYGAKKLLSSCNTSTQKQSSRT